MVVLELYGSNLLNSSCRVNDLFEGQPIQELKVSAAVTVGLSLAPLRVKRVKNVSMLRSVTILP